MTISLAKTWVNAKIRLPAAREDAVRLLDLAESENVEATLIIGPQLSTSGKCFFCRWDGTELVVRELTTLQQRDWSINPQGLFKQLERTSTPKCPFSSEATVALTVSNVGGDGPHDGWAPLSGSCIAETSPHQVIRNCALRAEYFHPELQCRVTSTWYSNQDLNSERVTLSFSFSPLFSTNNPRICHGTLVVLLQLYAAEDWKKNTNCRRISNVAETVITLR